MQVTDIGLDSPLLDVVYDELLVPNFPNHELITREELRAGLKSGAQWISAVVREGRPDGAAIAEWSPAGRVLLLSYMAVRRDLRSSGIGGALMAEIRSGWQTRVHPLLTLAEVEHPAAHTPDGEHGDQTARLRFYARHGARVLDVPYFQPSLRPGAARVPGMVLALLATAPELADAADSAAVVPSEPVRTYMKEYFEEAEGAVPDDPATTALFAAMPPAGIALLPIDDIASLPCTRDV
ncbi:GNAT family N-acetyltransferase [Streptomyces sp. NPDC060184]|uniref:GNAT family N-acetyltransferase n=1 Tax=Streptomyces sp. NPDC060184 TaxID=3347064 RepID=UPI00365273EC